MFSAQGGFWGCRCGVEAEISGVRCVVQFANSGDGGVRIASWRGCQKMTTKIGNEDPFDEVERGIDWLERLENMRARQDRESAILETVEYVEMLRKVIKNLSADATAESLSTVHGQEIADFIAVIGEPGTKDPWEEILKPALLER